MAQGVSGLGDTLCGRFRSPPALLSRVAHTAGVLKISGMCRGQQCCWHMMLFVTYPYASFHVYVYAYRLFDTDAPPCGSPAVHHEHHVVNYRSIFSAQSD